MSSAFLVGSTATNGSQPSGSPGFGVVHGGSRVASYTATTYADSITQPIGKLESISAMSVYKDKSHEELRWEDYCLGDNGQYSRSFGFCATPTAFVFTPSPFSSASTPSTFPNSSLFGTGGAFGGASTTRSAFRSTMPAFGAPNAAVFGIPAVSTFGTSTSASNPNFGQSTSIFGSSPFGSTTTGFGAHNPTFGSQATQPFGSPVFGQPGFRVVHGGSRIASHTATIDAQLPEKLESISAVPVYKDESHEEIRWEDYRLVNKGGQCSGGFGFSTTPPNAFVSTEPSPFSSASTSTFPGSSLFGLGTSSSSSSAPSLFSWPTTQPSSSRLASGWTLQNPQTTCSLSACGSSGPISSGSLFSSTPSTSSASTINVSISVEKLTTDLRLFLSLNGAAK